MRSATKKRTGKDLAYVAWLHTLPCVCCAFLEIIVRAHGAQPQAQLWPTEAAHVGDRGLSQKCPDREAIPLCAEHHRLDRFSAHRLQKKFWEHYGIDKKKLIERLNRAYKEQK